MPSNYVFENISKQSYEDIKSWLVKQGYNILIEEKVQYSVDCFSFLISNYQKIKIIYYGSNKLMFQSNPSVEFEKFIENLRIDFNLQIKQQLDKKIEHELEESIDKTYFIGFDESGAGECMGSVFLGCVSIKKEEIEYFKNILRGRDMKDLNNQQILDLYNDLKGKFDYDIHTISANFISEHNKNTSLDRGYCSLIDNLKLINSQLNECCMCIDDYGAGYDLHQKLNQFISKGVKVILQSKADINYVCSALASLVARRSRIIEMDKLSKENILIDPNMGQKIKFQSGAPNEESKIWLETYRKVYPYDDFPSFVRLKWKNVKEIDEKSPKKKLDYVFKCEYEDCKKPTNLLLFIVDKHKSEIYCPNCKNLISKKYFLESLPYLTITVDSSAIIDRTISKDLSNTGYLQNSKILLTSTLFEEIDSKQPDTKKGALNEIGYIKNSSYAGVLKFQEVDTEDYRDVSNDKKFMFVVRRYKSIILTKDINLARFTSLGVLVLQIIQHPDKISDFSY
mgnify:CR=1 FL=1